MAPSRSPDSTLELGEIAVPEVAARYEAKAGDGVGAYVLESELGRGGMGEVFQAYDPKLDRRVAIKFVTVHHASSVPRFVAEARATARCTHPNIVVIHDISEHQGVPFMVLELLRGCPVSQLLRDGPMALDTVVGVMLQVARALHHAHKQGIVHRDLKPANIFVTDDEIVKVLDFGIAKLLADPIGSGAGVADVPLPGHTSVGALVGTYEYMAPEQLTLGEVDHRADIWAFGVTMFQMIDGERPLEGAHKLALLAHAEDLDRSMPSLAERHPELPAAITGLVDQCLAKRRGDRPQDAAALVRALRAVRGAAGQQDDPTTDPGRVPVAGTGPLAEARPASGTGSASGTRTPSGTQAPSGTRPLAGTGPLAGTRASGADGESEQLTPVRVDPEKAATATTGRARGRGVRIAAVVAVIAVVALIIGAVAVRRWPRGGGGSEGLTTAQVARLAAELDRQLAAGERSDAEALIGAFVAEPGNQRSGAAALAWQAWGRRLVDGGDRDGGLAAYAQAYLTAPGDRMRLSPLAAIAELYVAERQWSRLGDVLAVLDGIPGGAATAARPRVLHDLAQGVVGGEERAPAAWRGVARALATGVPGPASIRRVARMQIDDDPADELLIYDGTSVAAYDLGDAITRRFELPGMETMRCAADVGERFVVIGGRDDGHAAVVYDHQGREVAAKRVEGWRCNPADRDGDGVPELYVYGDGRLLELKLGAGADLANATTSSWSLGSEIGAVGAADHAAGRSLLISVGEWRGYDLRLVDVRADGTLHLRDRVRLGLVGRASLVRRRGRPAVYAALVQDNHPSRKALGAATPAGAPLGLYLFDVGADAVTVRGRIDIATGNNATLVVADVDGDGGDELLVSACPDEHCTTTAIMLHDDDSFERFWLQGVEILERVAADDDPADEVAVVDDDRRLWVLGAGNARLPRRGHATPAAPRPPVGLDRPAIAQWQRADDLARIGLTAAAAQSFRTLRSLSTDPAIQDAALERAATLLGDGGDTAAAAAAWAELAASRRGAPAATARLHALEAHRDGHDLGSARALADALVADGLAALSPDERVRLDGLRGELAAPVVELVEDGRPHEAWRVLDPTGFYLDPAGGGLVIDSTTAAPVIATVGVAHRGGPLVIGFDFTMTRAEWAGEIVLELAPRGAPRGAVLLGMRGGGGGQATQRLAGLSGPGAYLEGAHPMRSVDDPVRARLTVTRVGDDRLRVRWDIEGSPTWEQHARAALPPGDYDLRVINGVPGAVASGVARIHRLSLVGFELLPRDAAERASSEAAGALSRNDARAALAALDRTPPADRWDGAKLRAIALQLLGRLDEARVVLRAALAAEGARRPARIAELAWLRRVRDGQFAALARAAAGDDLITLEALAWSATGYQHLYEPRVQELLADELADLPPGHGAQVEARAELHLLRGAALSVRKRTDEARAELERAFATATDPEGRQEAAVQLARDAAAAGDAREALRWAEAGLDVADDPLWVADQLLLDPAVRALAIGADWQRVRRPGRTVPSDIRTLQER